MTPEEREAIQRRLAEVTARMDEMQPALSSTVVPEWVELYKERALLEERLGNEQQ